MAIELTELQFDILDTLYFVEPFEKIVEEVNAPRPVVLAELRMLIGRGLVQVMRFDPKAQDYLPSPFLDADDLIEFRFLATKEGLMAHSGRS